MSGGQVGGPVVFGLARLVCVSVVRFKAMLDTVLCDK